MSPCLVILQNWDRSCLQCHIIARGSQFELFEAARGSVFAATSRPSNLEMAELFTLDGESSVSLV